MNSLCSGWLVLPDVLRRQLWQHARRAAPQECVGVLGGQVLVSGPNSVGWEAVALYPLPNVAPDPLREFLAGAPQFVRSLAAMRLEGLELVGIYHSHPRGPARFSGVDQARAAYPVPHLIADLLGGELHAFALPQGGEIRLLGVRPDEVWPDEL
ncbi:M67 family metallopeptidase [Deinococcus sp.]|uniref:M67 family metallopeptidase n=1 Tax=Deinococcus sp. TaxID=47478 RepID=UPI0025E7A07E|nr:M67 family metallopeptidase [Deinococcus sp.]